MLKIRRRFDKLVLATENDVPALLLRTYTNEIKTAKSLSLAVLKFGDPPLLDLQPEDVIPFLHRKHRLEATKAKGYSR